MPPGRIEFIAESSLSLLSEPHLKRLRDNGFQALLPGVESWFDLGNKSKTGAQQGMDKVRQVAEHVNLILRYIPYIQTNFVLGLDSDEGAEPFELTKRFLDLAPGAFPGYSLLTAFGRAAPLNLDYQHAGRVLPFPFHFLNNNQAINVRPRNYSWRDFYDQVIDLTGYSFSWEAILRRFRATRGPDLARHEPGAGRFDGRVWQARVLPRNSPPAGRGLAIPPLFSNGETTDASAVLSWTLCEKTWAALWEWLPAGALYHDPNAYAESERGSTVNILPQVPAPPNLVE